ncbi:MAG: hypothetical protein FJ387_31615 [Verrucomicrobia bacterium]|nr:hypothetical protein [Verrucomicrobiota bacterium]
MAVGGAGWVSGWAGRAGERRRVPGEPLPFGVRLRVQPVLTYHLDIPRERTSWRGYGGLRSEADVVAEIERLAW